MYFFHFLAYKDKIPLLLRKLQITIKREETFLGVLLNEHLTFIAHINCIEKKISKNIRVLYKASLVLNVECAKQLYFSFIYSYLNYTNITWDSTNKSKF